jgi:hypothetical protein
MWNFKDGTIFIPMIPWLDKSTLLFDPPSGFLDLPLALRKITKEY